MKQQTFSDIEYNSRKRKTRREEFLEIMDEIIPWDEWVSVIMPYYPSGKRGRPPKGIEKMLRMYLLHIPHHQMPVWIPQGSIPGTGKKREPVIRALCQRQSLHAGTGRTKSPYGLSQGVLRPFFGKRKSFPPCEREFPHPPVCAGEIPLLFWPP